MKEILKDLRGENLGEFLGQWCNKKALGRSIELDTLIISKNIVKFIKSENYMARCMVLINHI